MHTSRAVTWSLPCRVMVGTWSTRYLHCVSAIVRERDRRAPRKVQYVKPAINVETSFLAAVARVIPADWTRSIPRLWENMMWRGTPVDLSWFSGLLLERMRHLMIPYSWLDRHLLQESTSRNVMWIAKFQLILPSSKFICGLKRCNDKKVFSAS